MTRYLFLGSLFTQTKQKENKMTNHNVIEIPQKYSSLYLKVSSTMITSYDDEDCNDRSFNGRYDRCYDTVAQCNKAANRYRVKYNQTK